MPRPATGEFITCGMGHVHHRRRVCQECRRERGGRRREKIPADPGPSDTTTGELPAERRDRAVVLIRHAASLTPAERNHLAHWIREQANKLELYGTGYDPLHVERLVI